ncbi:MAG: archaeosortase/exosortase family protein [Candidatus Hydrogenedentes bacterium]|nr:archaeosortase/exosortase family protein [Candidatus Hydrogenedentota bacterium]
MANPTPGPAPRGGRSWVQMVTFFVVFVVIVLGLLIGYRYVIDTLANDWYLFQVARHTAWTLDHIGHEGSLEGDTRSGPAAARTRASLAAWDRGENAPSEADIAAASEAPLTPWEVFRFRLGRQIGTHNPAEIRATLEAWDRGESQPAAEAVQAASGAPLSLWEQYRFRRQKSQREGRSTGPRVWFVLRPGLETGLRDINQQIESIRDNRGPESTEPSREESVLEEQAAALQARLQTVRKESPRSAELGRYFVFIVVPECGAIEVMAIFLAAVIAFPTRWWKRFVGLVAGLPIMYLVNVLRLSCLAVVGALDVTPDRWVFSFAHEYVWQTVYIVFVVAVWLVWIEYVVRRKA